MNLHKLIFQFKVLVDKKTFTSAAESLFISQPTLTQNIQRLESALEVSLLVRDGKNISLTVYGESLYQHACLLDRSYRQALVDIDTIKRSRRQTLVIECGHAWTHGVLFELMKKYMTIYPNIRMVIKNSNATMGQEGLLKGECDLVLGAIPDQNKRISAINYISVFTTRFILFCSQEHPWAKVRNITEEQINECEWVILRHESEEVETRDPLSYTIPTARIRFEVFSVSSAISLVKQSHCIVALPLQLKNEALRRGLVPLDFAGNLPSFQTGIMYLDDVMKYVHKMDFINAIISYKSKFY